MGRLILPGEAQRKGGLTIIVPRDYVEREQEKIGACLVCGARFYKGQEYQWQRHVGDCAKQNIEALMAESPRRKMPIFDEANWDPEVAAHMRVVGKRMEEEKRVVMRSNERAGL